MNWCPTTESEASQRGVTVVFDCLQDVHVGLDAGQQFGRFGDVACFGVVHNHADDGARETRLEVLTEVLARRKAVVPHGDGGAVVDGEAQLRQRHVQLVHPAPA